METRKYFAFISYKREDEKWAKWLARELESFSLPSTLNGKELPKNLRPVFRDTDELSAGNLPRQIYNALSISKNLIVICSPRSAKSEWVNKEIKDFIAIQGGTSENVYPFIIEGTPFSKDSSKECFPDAIRMLRGNEERLGGNVNEQGGRDAAVVKIISGMLGVSFDSLWQKHEREQKRKRLIVMIALLLFALVCLIVGAYIVSQNIKLDEANREITIERDRTENANASLMVANDSIRMQKEKVSRINEELLNTNEQLTIERDNVIRANIEIKKAHGRITAGYVHNLIKNGNLLLAQRLLLSNLTESIVPEIEMELRKVDVTLASGVVSLMNIGQPYAKDIYINIIAEIGNTNKVALVMGNNLYMYDTQSGKLFFRKYIPFYISDVEFDKTENKVIVYGDNSIAYILGSENGEIVNTLDHEDKKINSICTDNFQYIVSCAGNILFIWNWQGELIDQYVCDNPINAIQFSPDSKRIALSLGNSVRMYNFNERRIEKQEFRHVDKVNSCNFSRDGLKILTCSNDSIVKIWNTETGKLNHELVHNGKVYKGSFDNRSNNVVTLDFNNNLVVWNLRNHVRNSIGYGYLGESEGTVAALIPGDELRLIDPFTQKMVVKLPISGALRSADFSIKKLIAVIAPLSGNVKLWKLGTNKLYRVFAHNEYEKSVLGNNYMIRDFKWNRDGTKFITAGYDNVAKIWKYPSFEHLLDLRGHTGGINTVCFDKEEKMVLTASCDSTMRLWDINTRTEKFIKKHSDEVEFANFINNDKYLMSISGCNINIYNAQNGNNIYTLSPIGSDKEVETDELIENGVVNAVYVKNIHKIISSYRNGYVRMWNMETGKLEKEIKVYNTRCYMTMAPNELNFVTFSDNGLINVWDVGNMNNVRSMGTEQVEMENATIYIDDGNLIASATSEGVINIWNVHNAKLVSKIDCYHGGISRLRICKNKKYLLAVCYDHHFAVIDMEKHEQVMAYYDEKLYLCPDFSPFYDEIIVPLGDGLISCYPWKSINELIDITKKRIGDNYEITPEEEKRIHITY